VAEVIMSVVARIQIVGAVATSIASALGLFVMFWLVSFFDVIPGIQSPWIAGGLVSGLPLLSFLCLELALSIDASQRRLQWPGAADLTFCEGGAFEAPPLQAGRV
jgi:hypothetical protein